MIERGGVLVVDKPRGPTSHDVVARVRRALGTRQVGHCGTLDPLATGVLVVVVGEATKLVPWLTSDDKAYEATLRLGVETSSFDEGGEETARAAIDAALLEALREGPASERLEAAVASERARTSQVPPAVSAIRIGGERAHALVRRGEIPDLPPREVTVQALSITASADVPEPRVDLVVEASKGYFVRALARDLAGALGTLGHLASLRRTRSGAFTIAESTPLDDPGDGDDPDTVRARRGARFARALLPLDAAAVRALPTARLTAQGVFAAERGQRVQPDDLDGAGDGPSAWVDETGRLVAVGAREPDGRGRVLRGFPR